jgi:hypothetical protein
MDNETSLKMDVAENSKEIPERTNKDIYTSDGERLIAAVN